MAETVVKELTPQHLPAGALDSDSEALLDKIFSPEGVTAEDPPAGDEPPVTDPLAGEDPPVTDPPAGDEPPVTDPPAGDDPSADIVDIPDDILNPPDPTAPPVEEEPVAEGAEEFPEGDENSQKAAWNTLAFEKRDLKRKNAELQKQLEEVSTKAEEADPQTVFELKEKLEQMENRLGQYSLAETSEFQKQYDGVIRERLGNAARLMIRSGLDEAAAKTLTAQVWGLTDLNDRVQLLGEEVPAVSGALLAIFEEADGVRARRADALQAWKTESAALTESRKRGEVQERLATTEKLTKDSVEASLAEGNFLYVMRDGQDAWNEKVNTRVDTLKGVLARQDPAEISRYVADGLGGRELRTLYMQQRERLKAAETEISKIKAARPAIGGGGGGGGDTPPANPGEGQTDEEIMDKLWSTPPTG